MNKEDSLVHLGWRPHFQSQADLEQAGTPVRVMNVHRGRVEIAGESGRAGIELRGRSARMGDSRGSDRFER